MNRPRHNWSPHNLDLLRAHYPSTPTADLAARLGLDIKLVYAQANRMGLHKGPEFLATSKSGRVLKGGKLGQARQFAPGQTPWNKGKHFVAGGRSAQTRFQPGNQPHTTLPVGAYRIVTDKAGRQSLEQKTGSRSGPNHLRWTPVTRLVWQATHGPVPKGSIIVFKAGQRTTNLAQITLDKLECITRAQNAARNQPRNSNPMLSSLYQLKGAITRQVNRIYQQNQAAS